jgi:hypothetical protein
MNIRVRFAGLLAVAALAVAGCAPITGQPTIGALSTQPEPSPQSVPRSAPESSPRPTPVDRVTTPALISPVSTPTPATYQLVGTARTTDGIAVSGVVIGFQRANCASCSPTTAVTGAGGRYSIRLVGGRYLAVCAARTYPCSPAGAAGGKSASYNVNASGTVDFTVEVASSVVTSPNGPGRSTAPASPSNLVDGFAEAEDSSSLPNVTLTFRLQHCGTCPAVTVTTDKDGNYTVSLGDGVWVATCTYPTAACVPLNATDGRSTTYDTTTGVGAGPIAQVRVPYGPDGPQSQPPQTPTLSGHVKTPDGKPVAGATVTLEPVAGNSTPHTTTDASGGYAFYEVGGVYNAICDASIGGCGGAGTDGGPNPVTLSGAQTLNFIACPQPLYPACLKG